MTVDQPDNGAPDRLPVRWAVIAGLSTAVAVPIGATEGIAFGLVAGLFTAAILHSLLK